MCSSKPVKVTDINRAIISLVSYPFFVHYEFVMLHSTVPSQENLAHYLGASVTKKKVFITSTPGPGPAAATSPGANQKTSSSS